MEVTILEFVFCMIFAFLVGVALTLCAFGIYYAVQLNRDMKETEKRLKEIEELNSKNNN